MDQHQVQVAFDRMQFRQPHVLDLLDNVRPIDVIHPLPAREAAQQVGLELRPGKRITVIEFVGRGQNRSASIRVGASGHR